MIIYSVGFPLSEDAVECAKCVAPELRQVGDGIPMMGSWEEHFPVYDIVLVRAQVIAIFLVKDEVRHGSTQAYR